MKLGRFTLLEVGLSSILLLSPIFFGSVYSWAYFSMWALIFFLFTIYPQCLKELVALPRVVFIVLVGVLAWVGLQFLMFSQEKYTTLIMLLQCLAGTLGFALIQLLPRHKVRGLIKTVLWTVLLLALYGLFMRFVNAEFVLWKEKVTHIGYITGTYINRNNFAGFLELGLGVLLGYWLKGFLERDVRQVLGYGCLFVVVFICFLKTGSRVGLLSFAGAFLLVALLTLKRGGNPLLIFMIFFLGCFGLGLWWAQDLLFERFESLTENMMTWEGRKIAWQDTLTMIAQYPIFGVGLGNFQWIFPQFQSGVLAWEWDHAHNDFLELASEIGLPAFGFILFAGIIYFSWIIKSLYRMDDEYFPYVWGGLIGVVALLAHGMSDFNFSIPANLLIFILLNSMIVRFCRGRLPKSKKPEEQSALIRWMATIGSHALRLVAAFFFLVSAQSAWAGVSFYQGQELLKQENPEQALEKFKSVVGLERSNPAFWMRQGEAYLETAIKTNDKQQLTDATIKFQRMTISMPDYGRAWLYLALAQTQGAGRLAGDDLSRFIELLRKAASLEPGSAWMAYKTGVHALQYRGSLSAQDQQWAVDQVNKSVRLNSQRYLGPSLQFLWEVDNDIETLLGLLPEDYETMNQAVRFFEENHLWQGLARLYPKYLELKNNEYDNLCNRGEAWIADWHLKKAYDVFDKAYWLFPNRVRAQAGRLIAAEGLDKLPKDYRKTIQSILLRNDASAKSLYPHLKELILLTQDPMLTTLYAYRMEDWNKVRQSLPRIDEEELDRYTLADIKWNLGEERRALELMIPVLRQEKADLNDLLLLDSWDTKFDSQIVAKIDEQQTVSKPARGWWGEGFENGRLDDAGRMGMELNLRPGMHKVIFSVKGIPNQKREYANVLFRYQGETVGAVYADKLDGKGVVIPIHSQGGRGWFEAELIYEKSKDASQRSPIAIFGDVQIKS